MQQDILNILSHWPQVHIGELGVLKSGRVVVLQHLMRIWWGANLQQLVREVDTKRVASWFEDVAPQMPGITICHHTLKSPVIVVRTASDKFYGIDGASRVKFALENNIPKMRVLFLDEQAVYEAAALDPDRIAEPDDDEVPAHIYRRAQNNLTVAVVRVETRPGLKEEAARVERVLGAAKPSPTVQGRPYATIFTSEDYEYTFSKGKGRREIPGLEQLDQAIARIFAALRRLGVGNNLGEIIEFVSETTFKMPGDEKTYLLGGGLPNQREIERWTPKNEHLPMSVSVPAGVKFSFPKGAEALDQDKGLLLHLYDHATLRRRLFVKYSAEKGFNRDTQRKQELSDAVRKDALFGDAGHPTFVAQPYLRMIPGFFDPLALSRATGLTIPHYFSEILHLQGPFFLAASPARGKPDPIQGLSVACSFLQYVARAQAGCSSPYDGWWGVASGLYGNNGLAIAHAVRVVNSGHTLLFEPLVP